MKKGILIIIGSALGSTLFLFTTFFVTGGDAVEHTILNAHGYIFKSPVDHQLPVSDAIQIKSLIEKGYVVNTGELISDISNFYSSIIELLVVIIGILGVVAFMYVRAGSETVAEEKASAAVNSYFGSQIYHELLLDKVSVEAESVAGEIKEFLQTDLASLEKYAEFLGAHDERLDEIEAKMTSEDGVAMGQYVMRLAAIEEKLSSIDRDEMEGLEDQISIRDEGGS